MNESATIFKPKYSTGQVAAFVLLPVVAAFLIYNAVASGGSGQYIAAAVIVAVMIGLSFRIVRQIEFGDKVIVKRLLTPSYEFDYTDILDIGITTVRTKPGKGNIFLPNIENFNELKEIITETLAQQDATQNQLEGKLGKQEVNEWIAAGIAQVATIPIMFALEYADLSWLRFADSSTLLLTYFAVFFVSYFVIKQMLSMRSESEF